PAGLHAPHRDGAAARPPLREPRRLLHWDFRSSIARLLGWLSTLRSGGYPTTTQDSLPGAGWTFLGGLAYPQGFAERFPSCSYISFPLPELTWRNPLTVALQVELALVGENVVLAGHVGGLAYLRFLEDLGDRVEFRRFRHVGEIN